MSQQPRIHCSPQPDPSHLPGSPATGDSSRLGGQAVPALGLQQDQVLRDLAKTLPQLIWIADETGRKTYCNQQCLRYTGIRSTAEMNTLWLELIHPEDRAAASHAWQFSLKTGQPYVSEYRLRRHDGVYRHFMAQAQPLRNWKEEIEGWLGTSTEIHDQKVAEEIRRRAEKLSAASRVAASVAHEINNPLAAATNALYLAQLDTQLNSTTREYLRLAEEQLARVAHVTARSVGFHRQASAPSRVHLGDVMDSALAIFAGRLQDSSIALRREYPGNPSLHCFQEDVRQIFANLISNALEALPNGGCLRIRIRSAHAWDRMGAPGVRVLVADNGHGIPPSLLHHVFDAFVSSRASTGSGLGLWITREILLRHHGRIAVHSNVDPRRHGTVFALFFPHTGIAH